MSLNRYWLVACCLLLLGLPGKQLFASGSSLTTNDDAEVLMVAREFLDAPDRIQSTKIDDLCARLPKSAQRHQLALVSWALLRPTGIEETSRSKNLEALFWLAFRSLCRPTEKSVALRVIDDSQLKSGDLALALELLYRDDDVGRRRELERRGLGK